MTEKKQTEFPNAPNSEIRTLILDFMGFKEDISKLKEKQNEILYSIITEIKKSGRKSMLCENEDGDSIVVRLIASTEKILISKPPKKKKIVKD